MEQNNIQSIQIDYFLEKLKIELLKANEKYPPVFNSMHEGYAVLLEEVEEMWDEIKKKNKFDKLVKEECIQVGAMAVKFLCSFFKEQNYKRGDK